MSYSSSLSLEVKQISLASSLFDGIEDNDLAQIKYLLNTKDVDPNFVLPDKGISAMHFIAGSQPESFVLEVTRLLLLHGGDPNVRSTDCMTPVHVAAAWGQGALLQLLLTNGGDPALCDDEGLTALNYATKENHTQLIEILNNFSGSKEPDNAALNNVTLLLEKLLVEEGEFAAEFQIVADKTDEVSSPNSNQASWELHKANVASLNHDESWKRVANWCEEQSLLSISPLQQNQQSCDKKPYFIPPILLPSPIQLINCATNSQLVEANKPEIQAQGSVSESGTFFTCASHRKTISSRVSSAVSAVYKYTDRDHGVVLIEKRMPVSSCTSATEVSESEVEIARQQQKPQSTPAASSVSSIPSDRGYSTEVLRNELQRRGFPAGPITTTTKRVYLKRLARLQKGCTVIQPASPAKKKFSRELERTLRDLNTLNLQVGLSLEQKMAQQFSNPPPHRQWREGVAKCSFTYLLLDPRVTCNLPLRATSLSPVDCWRTFVRSIFYVGKGKRSRPYSHLYHALDVWKHRSNKTDCKTEHIMEIWRAGFGVVCLHVFQSIIPVEAYTREAAMIDALGVENVRNLKRGEYYGELANKSPEQRRILGVYFLYRAMHVLLHEGERQLQPLDIDP